MMGKAVRERGSEVTRTHREVQTDLAEWCEVGPRRWVRRVREWRVDEPRENP